MGLRGKRHQTVCQLHVRGFLIPLYPLQVGCMLQPYIRDNQHTECTKDHLIAFGLLSRYTGEIYDDGRCSVLTACKEDDELSCEYPSHCCQNIK